MREIVVCNQETAICYSADIVYNRAESICCHAVAVGSCAKSNCINETVAYNNEMAIYCKGTTVLNQKPKYMKRKKPVKPAELFPLHKLVKEQLKEKNLNISQLAKTLRCNRSVISRLLDTPDWLVSEMQAVGAALGTNLFTYYVPAPDTTAQEQLQQTITQLQQQLSERDKQLAEAHIENKILQAKLEVLTGKRE